MKTVVITGATRGIGYALTQKFLKGGYNVVGFYRSSDEIANSLTKEGALMIKGDVSQYKDVENLFSVCQKKFGGVDILINNAGVCLPQKFILDVDEGEFDKVFNVNVKGVFNCTKQAISLMLTNNTGKIVNVSSIFGLVGGSCESVYSASKHAVLGFTKSVSMEVENSNIDIFAVCLGLVETEMNEHLSYKDKMDFLQEYCLKKWLTPSVVADRIYKILQKNNLNGKIFKIGVGKIK